jgi:hypothetical protein
MVDKRKDIKFNVGRTSDATLKALFECAHDEVVCVKCLGLGKCEHDCKKCFEEAHGKQLNLEGV